MTRFSIAGAASLVGLLAFSSVVPAADKVWTGAGITRAMSEGANWQGGIPPATGDRLFFPAVTQFALNDIQDASFDSLWFSGDGDPNHGFLLYGNPITLTGSPTITAQGFTVWFVTTPLAFTSSNPRLLTTGTATPNDRRPVLQLSQGAVTLSGGLMEVVAEVGSIELMSDISELSEASIQVSGVEVALTGNNSFTGTLQAFGGGWFSGQSAHAFGSPSAPTIVSGDTFFFLASSETNELVIPEPLVLASTAQSPYWGTLIGDVVAPIRLTGAIALETAQVIDAVAPMTLDGPVSGAGHLEIGRGGGVVNLNNPNNTFTGGVTVSRGTLRTGRSLAIPLGNSVSILAEGSLDVNLTFQGLGDLACSGRIGAMVGWGLITVNGITLSNCALDLAPADPTFIPRSQEIVTVVENHSGAPFNAEFVGYPEGTVVNVNGVETRATYHARGYDFALVAQALPVANVVAVAGTPQSLALGATSPAAFAAKALDAWARPLANARITFTAPAGCGTFGGSSSAQVLTDAFGVATSPAFTAGNASQVCMVQAQGDAGGTANFEVHLYALADVVLTAIPAALSTVVDQPFSLAAELRGANGMSLPGLQVSFQAVPRGNSGVASLTPSALTDATNSRAVATGVANSKSGNYDIVVSFGTISRTVPVSQKGK